MWWEQCSSCGSPTFVRPWKLWPPPLVCVLHRSASFSLCHFAALAVPLYHPTPHPHRIGPLEREDLSVVCVCVCETLSLLFLLPHMAPTPHPTETTDQNDWLANLDWLLLYTYTLSTQFQSDWCFVWRLLGAECGYYFGKVLLTTAASWPDGIIHWRCIFWDIIYINT